MVVTSMIKTERTSQSSLGKSKAPFPLRNTCFFYAPGGSNHS